MAGPIWNHSRLLQPAHFELMLTIRNEHKMAFFRSATRTIRNSLQLALASEFPEWCKSRSEAERNSHIEEIINFSHENNIFQEESIWSLAKLRILHPFSLELSAFLKDKIDRQNLDEHFRVEEFTSAILSGKQLTVICIEQD